MALFLVRVVRRYLLYAGGKPFNPNFQDDVDRVTDYVTALEATLVPKSDFLSRTRRERAVRLLGLSGELAKETTKLLTTMYEIRSTLVHGSPLSASQSTFLQDRDQWLRSEEIVRQIIVAALRSVPSNEDARIKHLANLYQPSDSDRATKIREDFKAIKDTVVRSELLQSLRPLQTVG